MPSSLLSTPRLSELGCVVTAPYGKGLERKHLAKGDGLAVIVLPCTELVFCQQGQELPSRSRGAWPTTLQLCIYSLILESQYHWPPQELLRAAVTCPSGGRLCQGTLGEQEFITELLKQANPIKMIILANNSEMSFQS